MKTLWLICVLLLGGAAAVTVFAEGGAFDDLSMAVKRKTVQKMAGGPVKNEPKIKAEGGKPTGGFCKADADCSYGCQKGMREAACFNQQEIYACDEAKGKKPSGKLKCGCLVSMNRCGFTAH